MRLNISLILLLSCFGFAAVASQADSQKLSIGKYSGYAEFYFYKDGEILNMSGGNMGGECSVEVFEQSLQIGERKFVWDSPFRQASRTGTDGQKEVVILRGINGKVFVIDYIVYKPQGDEKQYLTRMCVAWDDK